jgi:hypothetical protein
MTAISKASSKHRTRARRDTRRPIGSRQGNVKLRRASPLDLAYHGATAGTLTEWNSKADDHACRDL